MKCLYIPTDIQYIHDKQWNVFTYLETNSTFMTNNEMSLHTHRHTVHSWQTMKCLYIPREIQYIHDKQWNVFTYRETYSTFMTNNEMSLHTHRHTVHSWQTMKCLYIPREDIQYIHDKQWNVFTYLETYSTFMTNNEMSLHTHRHTVHSWQTMKCLYIPRDIQYIHDKQWNVFTYRETYSTFMTNNEMSLHTHRHTVHSWQTMKCLYIPREDRRYIHDKQWNVFTYPETYSTFMTNNEMSLHT